MPSSRDKRTRGRLARIAAAATLIACLAIPGSAIAGQDMLKGGSVTIQLQGSRGLKLSPGTLSLPITGGQVDPVDGSGTVPVSGSFKAKRGKHKTKVTITSLTFGANGAPGSIAAKIGKKKVSSFGALAGGTVTRDGWGAKIQSVSAMIARKGAQALNKAFQPRKGKGAKSAAGGGVKAGQPLGTVSATTVPATVEVLPGSGTLVLNIDALASGGLAMKLPQHCISLVGGAAPIPPATVNILGTQYTFPVTGGAVAPDFSDGALVTGGGQTLTKDNGLLTPGACGAAQPPVGTQLVSKAFQAQFNPNGLASTTTLPTGFTLLAVLGDIDWSTGSRSIDPNTKDLTVTNASVTLAALAAPTLNQVFPTESGNAGDDFAAGDVIGTVSMTAKLR